MTLPIMRSGLVPRHKTVGGDRPPVRKMVQLRADQARWLEDQAHEARMSEAAIVRHLIEAAMMEVQG